MKRTGDIYLIIIGLLLGAAMGMTSCVDRSSRAALLRAEALMESDPHAARAVLDSLGPHPIPPLKGREASHPSFRRGKREAALYALLRTQADYKCYVPLRSDSLARIATDYYGTPRHKNYHAAMAWYTLGCVYTDQAARGKATVEQAFDAYLKAKPLFPDPANRNFALCCQNLGRCYMERTLYHDAIREYEESKQSSLARNDSAQVATYDYYIGFCHLALEEFAAADSFFCAVRTNPHAKDVQQKVLLLDMAKVDYYYHNDADAAIHKLHAYIDSLSPRFAVSAAYDLLGTIYDERNEPDSATLFYEKSLKGYNMMYSLYNVEKNELSLYLRQHGDSIHAARFQQFVAVSDSLFSSRNRAQLIVVENSYRQAMLTERHKRQTTLIIVFSLLLLVALLWYATYRLRRKDAQYIKVYDALRAAQLREEQAKSKASFYNTLDIAIRQFTAGPTWQFIDSMRNGHAIAPAERIAFCRDLNIGFSEVFGFLQREGYAINSKERLITACYALGLNSEEAEAILHIKDGTIRAYKKHVKDRLPSDIATLLFSSK